MIDPGILKASKGFIIFIGLVISGILHFFRKKRRFKQIKTDLSQGKTLDKKFLANETVTAHYLNKKFPTDVRRLFIICSVVLLLFCVGFYSVTQNFLIVKIYLIIFCVLVFPMVSLSKYQNLYLARLKKVKNIIGDKEKFIEIRDNGINFNVVFLEPYSFKKIIENNEAYIYIPWQDMKSIGESSCPALGGRPGTSTEKMRNCLIIKLKSGQPSEKKLGKQFFLTLNMINDYIGMEFLIKKSAGNMVKCRI